MLVHLHNQMLQFQRYRYVNGGYFIMINLMSSWYLKGSFLSNVTLKFYAGPGVAQVQLRAHFDEDVLLFRIND